MSGPPKSRRSVADPYHHYQVTEVLRQRGHVTLPELHRHAGIGARYVNRALKQLMDDGKIQRVVRTRFVGANNPAFPRGGSARKVREAMYALTKQTVKKASEVAGMSESPKSRRSTHGFMLYPHRVKSVTKARSLHPHHAGALRHLHDFVTGYDQGGREIESRFIERVRAHLDHPDAKHIPQETQRHLHDIVVGHDQGGREVMPHFIERVRQHLDAHGLAGPGGGGHMKKARPARTKNPAWGFHGTVRSQHGHLGEGADAIAERVYAAAHRQLRQQHKMSHHEARSFLDSRWGRHMADEIGEHPPERLQLPKWTGKTVEHWRRQHRSLTKADVLTKGMTKRHFEQIADAFVGAHRNAKAPDVREGVTHAMTHATEAMRSMNPRFNPQRFHAWVSGKTSDAAYRPHRPSGSHVQGRMTRQHFSALAGAFKRARETAPSRYHAGIDLAEQHVTNAFRTSNPRFSNTRYARASHSVQKSSGRVILFKSTSALSMAPEHPHFRAARKIVTGLVFANQDEDRMEAARKLKAHMAHPDAQHIPKLIRNRWTQLAASYVDDPQAPQDLPKVSDTSGPPRITRQRRPTNPWGSGTIVSVEESGRPSKRSRFKTPKITVDAG